MFQDLDDTLTNLLGDPNAPAELRAAAVMFLPPDRNFNGKIPGQTAVNLFLHRIRENRELADNVPFPEPDDPPNVRREPLLRVDCSYLVTTWSKEPGDAEVRTEHQLLGQALQWLSRFPTIPTNYLSGSLNRDDFPLPFAMSARLDAERVPVDFWTALGIAPRPSFDLTVTIAIDLQVQTDDGPPVILKEIDYKRLDPPAPPILVEKLFSIGGTVRRATDGSPLNGASVLLMERAQTLVTGADGQFLFDGLLEGSYRLRASAPGLATQTRRVDVPNLQAGEFDFAL
jgi:hypothetical protein